MRFVLKGVPPDPEIRLSLRETNPGVVKVYGAIDSKEGKVLAVFQNGEIRLPRFADLPGLKTDDDGCIVVVRGPK